MNCTDWNTFSSLDDLNERYYNYINSEYNNHFHSSIEDTPRNRFMRDYSLIKFIQPDEILDECFLYTYERTVATDSTIQLYSKKYEVPSRYIRQIVAVRIDPHKQDNAYIYKNGKRIETISLVKKVENSKMKRKSISYARSEELSND